MTTIIGLQLNSPWLKVVRRPPSADILQYLHTSWQEYVAEYENTLPPLSKRTEPQLTEGFGAFLGNKFEAGQQPFDGTFYAELTRFDIESNGMAKPVGRTDIEWTLYGFASFIVEFKLIGGGRLAIYYVTEGISRFVNGRYGAKAREGAMWAIIRPGSTENMTHVQAHVDRHASELRCVAENGQYRFSPSTLSPLVAAFDSVHERDTHASPIRIAHVFTELAK